MGFKELIDNFRRNFCNYKEYEDKISLLQEQYNLKQKLYDGLSYNYNQQNDFVIAQKKSIEVKDALISEYEIQLKNLTPIDSYCQAKGYEINNFAYKDKIIINGIKINCNLREMITPSSFVVEKTRKTISKEDNILSWYQNVMNKVAVMVTWTDDGRDDNYSYPAYTLTTGKGDCDDMAFAQCSLEPELGNAFGFKKTTGHSFAVGIVDGTLWIFDAVFNTLMPLEGSDYKINYIITKNNIYVVNGNTDFGKILWK
jgi:hypothetical protein